ncbi:hypothetical protein [Roseitalea porphyridii]|uniref:Uncharacterized protein n=1 Tax=Roseitalea porphyridii TaxID=1852022 RepID=A0A4P6V5N9_9HYPH|nr:hypothetical protein [Roseitalea porphyridii]QBK31916.1 hypothetical protein E0E05_15750 [Roseitalea porphyridii]
MTVPSASSSVIAFPQPTRQRHVPPAAARPSRQGPLRGAVTRGLAGLRTLGSAGVPQRPDLADGSVSPLY